MPDRPQVVVIGAGIIGCSVAYELARRGGEVIVFEARALGSGATHASAGVLAPHIEAHEPGHLLDFKIRSLQEYERFVADVMRDAGMDIEYRITGTLEVTLGDDQPDVPDGGPGEWLTAENALAIEPALAHSIRGARLVREQGYVAAPQLLEALSWAALKHGAQIEANRRIASVKSRGGTLTVEAEDKSAWVANHVVLAAGSWASQAGLEEPAARAVRPVRGQLLRLAWADEPPRHVIWGPDCYAVPWRDGTVLVGATVEEVGYDERTTAAGVHDLLDAVSELLPAAWRAAFIDARAGLRPGTSDGLPIIGPSTEIPGLVYATGHYRNGILLAPLTARLVADYLLDGRVDPALENFSPRRFQSH